MVDVWTCKELAGILWRKGQGFIFNLCRDMGDKNNVSFVLPGSFTNFIHVLVMRGSQCDLFTMLADLSTDPVSSWVLLILPISKV